KPGMVPEFKHLYWVGNTVEVGGLAKLRAHFRDLILGQECPVTLIHRESGKEVAAPVKLKVDKAEAEVVIPIPVEFGIGSKLEATTSAALAIRPVGGVRTDAADWRKYIDQPAVPAEILDVIKKNRAQFTMRKIALVESGKYAGPQHYNYKPGKAHITWANEYV